MQRTMPRYDEPQSTPTQVMNNLRLHFFDQKRVTAKIEKAGGILGGIKVSHIVLLGNMDQVDLQLRRNK
jgi:hypothetical protein